MCVTCHMCVAASAGVGGRRACVCAGRGRGRAPQRAARRSDRRTPHSWRPAQHSAFARLHRTARPSTSRHRSLRARDPTATHVRPCPARSRIRVRASAPLIRRVSNSVCAVPADSKLFVTCEGLICELDRSAMRRPRSGGKTT